MVDLYIGIVWVNSGLCNSVYMCVSVYVNVCACVCVCVCRVPEFEGTKYLITNGEFLGFVKAGAYSCKDLWTNEGTGVYCSMSSF